MRSFFAESGKLSFLHPLLGRLRWVLVLLVGHIPKSAFEPEKLPFSTENNLFSPRKLAA
jgi:hypothetical protein